MHEKFSEFEAPVYTTVDVRNVGTQVVRAVILDGEMQEFVVSRELYRAGVALEDDK